MAIKKLCSSVFLGAVVGGIYAMTDREVRTYVKEQITKGKSIVQNPKDSIGCAVAFVEKVKTKYELESEKILNKVEQLESTLGRFGNSDDDETFKKIEE